MTTKRSQFGSLEQRRARSEPQAQVVHEARPVRHVWLDGSTAALVTDRRKRAGRWEAYVLYVAEDGFVTHEWVEGSRIRLVERRDDPSP